MIVTEATIAGVYLINPVPYKDHRGLLRRNYCRRVMQNHEIDFTILQTNISENRSALTLRGFHFQLAPYQEIKQISCVRGSIYGIVLDMRQTSSTYCQWVCYECDGKNRTSIIIPKGCASAYLTLQPDTWILYYHSEFYEPGHEFGIRYNDPYFDFTWPAEPAVISEKDATYTDFDPWSFSQK